MTDQGLLDLKRMEGLRLDPYRDTMSHWTVGYGHNLETTPISRAAALHILMDDVVATETELALKIPFWHDLSYRIQDVLINVAFNLGVEGLLKFKKTLFFLAAKQWENAADELLDSQAARDLPGRYKELSDKIRKEG
jgi:lysozyme